MTIPKKTTSGGTRHISRFYVYTSTLTQCTFDSPTSHSFHGSNSSNFKDNGLVALWCNEHKPHRTLAQIGWSNVQHPKLRNKVCLLRCSFIVSRVWKQRASYANEKSSVISVTFDEDKGTPKTIMTILVIFLLFTAIFLMVPKSVERSTPTTTTTNLHDWSKQQIDLVRGDNPSQLDSS